MAKTRIQQIPSGSYVYQLIVDDVVRYIGKGTGRRVHNHFSIAATLNRRRAAGEKVKSTILYNRLAKALRTGRSVDHKIVADGPTSDQAYSLEIESISSIPSGQLWNVRPGGVGMDSETLRIMWKDPEYRARRTKMSRDMWASDEHRKIMKMFWSDPEQIKRQRETMLVRWADPIYRKKYLKDRDTPEYRSRISKRSKENWQDDSIRSKMLAALKAKDTPERRAKASKHQSKIWELTDFRDKLLTAWSDQERRARQSEMAKSLWSSNPDRRKARFSEDGSREKQSAMVRAKWADPAYREKQKIARANGKKRVETKFSEKRSALAKARWADPEFRERTVAAIRRSKSAAK
jgi:hypothetical protein